MIVARRVSFDSHFKRLLLNEITGRIGQLAAHPAPGVYSDNIQTGGTRGYGTV